MSTKYLSTVFSVQVFDPLCSTFPRYFIFAVIVNEIVFLISLSVSSLLEEKQHFLYTDFYTKQHRIHLLFIMVFLVES